MSSTPYTPISRDAIHAKPYPQAAFDPGFVRTIRTTAIVRRSCNRRNLLFVFAVNYDSIHNNKLLKITSRRNILRAYRHRADTTLWGELVG
eukprot:4225853-Pyramimonas_sp.AAC.2